MLFYNITELSQVTNQVHLITSRHIKCNLLGMINLGKARYQQYMGIHIGCHSGNRELVSADVSELISAIIDHNPKLHKLFRMYNLNIA